MKSLIFFLTAGLFTIFVYGHGLGSQKAPSKPNIIFILVDDLGWSDVGFNGSKYYQTPNIDKLAAQGAIFTQCYMNPDCAPSRASLMTGQYPPRTGIYAVDDYARTPKEMIMLQPVVSEKIPPSKKITIAEVLKQGGYTTASIGKWHLGNDTATWPQGQGFDVNVAGCDRGSPITYFSPYTGLTNITPGESGEYLTTRLTDEAISFVEKNQRKPFFLYLPFYSVHVPVHALKQFVEKYNNRRAQGGQNIPAYGGMVSYVDYSVGRLFIKLRELGLDKNTVIIFTSDNGGQLMCTDNAPLRGQKGSFYEGGIRVPMFVYWAGKIKEGSHVNVPVSVVDFLPTLAEIGGVDVPVDQPNDGQSIVPLITGQGDWKERSLFWHLPGYHGNGRTNALTWQDPAGAIRKENWKLIEHFGDGRLELYNIEKDISEQHNLADTETRVAQELLKELNQWQQEIKAPIPSGRNSAFDASTRAWIKRADTRIPGEVNRQIVIKDID